MTNHRSEEDINRELQEIRAAQKDHRQFGVLYDRYFTDIFRFIYRRVGDKDICGDVTQLTFLKAMANIRKFRPKGVPFSAWLYRIAINEVNMYYRRNNKVQVVGLNEAITVEIITEVEEGDSEENRRMLVKALNSLDAGDAEIIEMRFFEHLSFREIGDVLGIKETAAKVRTYRVLDKLKERIGEK